jgi:hypothetical protein
MRRAGHRDLPEQLLHSRQHASRQHHALGLGHCNSSRQQAAAGCLVWIQFSMMQLSRYSVIRIF